MRSQEFDEESPPTSLLSIYLRSHNTYPILVLLLASRRRRTSQGTHTLMKFSHDSVDVIYEQDVGSKSSINVETASRKYLTLQGCTNCPLQGSARTPISLSCYPS